MDWLVQLFTTYGDSAAAGGLAATSTKAAIILSAALVATWLLRKSTASTRHHVWALALLAVLALPVLSMALPAWQLPILPAASAVQPASVAPGAQSVAPQPRRSEESPSAATPVRAPLGLPSEDLAGGASGAAAKPSSGMDEGAATAPVRGEARLSDVASLLGGAPGRVVVALWGVGLTFFLIRLLVSCGSAAAVVRRATPVIDAGLLAQANEVRQQLQIRGDVKIVSSDRITMPMAWGIVRPVVLLPAAALQWAADKRRVVLLHEMAHLKRRDCQTLMLARVVAAVHWFNPLAWTATRRMQAERERACDDLVLSTGTDGPDYAQHLLDIARGMRTNSGASWAAVAMARPHELEGRLLAILDPSRRRGGATRRASVIAAGALSLLVLPLAAVQPSAIAQEPREVNVQVRPQIRIDDQVMTNVDRELRTLDRVNVDLRPPIDVNVNPQTFHSGPGAAGIDGLIKGLAAEAAEELMSGGRSAELTPAQEQRNERVIQAFLVAIQDENAEIRAQAAYSLGMIESSAGIDALGEALRNDVDAEVREQAAWALGMIESADAIPALAAAVSDADEGVREQVVWAMGMIESPDSVPALATSLRDESADVREQAAWALGMIETREAVAPLMQTLRDDQSAGVREQAAWALGMIEDEAALDALLDAMSDENLSVRKQALWAVSQISR